MNFDISKVECRPHNEGKNFYGCNYYANGVELFYERTWVPRSFFHQFAKTPADLLHSALSYISNPIENSEQWFNIGWDSEAEARAFCAKHDGARYREQYYKEGSYFLWFEDTDKALAFCLTDDFDKHNVGTVSEPDTFT